MNEIICLDGSGSRGFRPEGIRKEISRSCGILPCGQKSVQELFREARELTASLFGAGSPDQVVFTKNASEAMRIVVTALMRYGDNAVTTVMDHENTIGVLMDLTRGTERLSSEYCFRSRTGWRIVTGFSAAELLGDRRIDYDSLRRAAVRKRPAVILCTHASSLTGDLTDLKRVSGIAREVGAYFVVDAVRTAGIFPLNVDEIGADALCFSGSIGIPGPSGTAGFVLGSAVNEKRRSNPAKELPFPISQLQGRYESGSRNVSGMAGYHAALRYLRLCGIAGAREAALGSTARFLERVREIRGIRLHGNYDDYARAPLVALTAEGRSAASVSAQLREKYGILTAHGTCGAPLHAEALGLGKDGAVRFAFDFGCSAADADAAADALMEICDERR